MGWEGSHIVNLFYVLLVESEHQIDVGFVFISTQRKEFISAVVSRDQTFNQQNIK